MVADKDCRLAEVVEIMWMLMDLKTKMLRVREVQLPDKYNFI